MVVIWKGCFDESYDAGASGRFIYSGLFANQPQWDAFYPAWEKALAAERSIASYHGSEKGQRDKPGTCFHGWTDDEVEQKELALADEITANTAHQFVGAIDLREFYHVMDRSRVPKSYIDPSLLGFAACLMGTAKFMEKQAGDNGKPILVFDRLPSAKQKNRFLRVYDAFRDAKPADDAYVVGRWLAPQPLFLDDSPSRSGELFDKGLQAADLVAGAWRNEVNARVQGLPPSGLFRSLDQDIGGYVWREEDIDRHWKWPLYRLLGLHPAGASSPDQGP